MKILVINGPNMHKLGVREPEIYGRVTYEELVRSLEAYGQSLGAEVVCFQSNHEGDIVDVIDDAGGVYDGIVINPAAYTHTSIAILDALRTAELPAVEVHISDLSVRESFRQFSYTALWCEKVISGHGLAGYREAIGYLCAKERKN